MSPVPPPSVARGPASTPHSGIRELANEAIRRPGSIRLDLGQPDFRTPAHIGEAAKLAIDQGFNFYTHTQGLLPLREALAARIAAVNGISVGPGDITIGPGGVGAIAAAFGALLDPGDEVLLPDPAWPNYRMMLGWLPARPVYYPCPIELGFQPDLERLAGLISPRTRLLVINNPNNPTGAVYPRSTLERMADLAQRGGLWVLADECYDQVLLEGPNSSVGSFLDDGRVITVGTFSKSYSMCGWRIGYASGAPGVIDSMTKVLESNSSCVSTISQKAAEAALAGPQDCISEMVSAYRRRRDLVVDLLDESGLLLAVPRGAFYAMADIRPAGLDARSFALRLLSERGVSVAPGTAFGQVAAAAVRISLASSDEDLREGVSRLCEFVGELSGRGERAAGA
ncbi:MAG: pyridoxal phosphate-dependent aminotransferase [Candidatus Dormibacteraceae bacterium]